MRRQCEERAGGGRRDVGEREFLDAETRFRGYRVRARLGRSVRFIMMADMVMRIDGDEPFNGGILDWIAYKAERLHADQPSPDREAAAAFLCRAAEGFIPVPLGRHLYGLQARWALPRDERTAIVLKITTEPRED